MILDILSESRVLARGLDVGRLAIGSLVLVIVGHPEALRELEPVPDIILSLAKDLRVNGEVQGLVARVLHPGPQVLVDLGDLGEIDLEKLQGVGGLGCHVFQAGGGPGTQLDRGAQVAISCTRGRKLAL